MEADTHADERERRVFLLPSCAISHITRDVGQGDGRTNLRVPDAPCHRDQQVDNYETDNCKDEPALPLRRRLRKYCIHICRALEVKAASRCCRDPSREAVVS